MSDKVYFDVKIVATGEVLHGDDVVVDNADEAEQKCKETVDCWNKTLRSGESPREFICVTKIGGETEEEKLNRLRLNFYAYCKREYDNAYGNSWLKANWEKMQEYLEKMMGSKRSRHALKEMLNACYLIREENQEFFDLL